MRVQDSVVVITGASSGIRRATALAAGGKDGGAPEHFGLTVDDLNIDLGPLGRLL
jgi:hypothetical protein